MSPVRAVRDIGRKWSNSQMLSKPPSQRQLAARLEVDRTTMVGRVDAREAKGLLARRPHPDDRRKNAVELTAAGRRTLTEAGAAADAAQAEFLAPLGDGAARFVAD